MADACCNNKGDELVRLAHQAGQRRVLILVLTINALMFLVEFGGGLWAGSASLMADSVDMLGDALVYGASIFVLSRSPSWKAGAAALKGGIILFFGLGVLVQIGFKIAHGVPPVSGLMLGFGTLALVANLTCLALLWRFRAQDVNMSSTFECSRNDVAANIGVLVAALLVGWLGSVWPDIAVAGVIALLFLRSSFTVLSQSLAELRSARAKM